MDTNASPTEASRPPWLVRPTAESDGFSAFSTSMPNADPIPNHANHHPVEARPVVVPLAEAKRFKHYVGLSPARARKLHLTEGFPLRFRGEGGRRSAYVLLEEAFAWWKRQHCE